jgi:hypothetical protein
VLALFLAIFVGRKHEFHLAVQSYFSQQTQGQVADAETIRSYRGMEYVYGVYTSLQHQRLGQAILEETLPDETIFVWDSVPGIYFYAQRRAPTFYYKPYFSSSHLPWSVYQEGDRELVKIRKQIIHEISQNPPTYVIHLNQPMAEYPDVEPLFDELSAILTRDYQKDETLSDAVFSVWKLAEPMPFVETVDPLDPEESEEPAALPEMPEPETDEPGQVFQP